MYAKSVRQIFRLITRMWLVRYLCAPRVADHAHVPTHGERMFRQGRGGDNWREGRRPWRRLGRARVACVLLVTAVANSTWSSTATNIVIKRRTPRSCGLVHGHHQYPLPSSSRRDVRSLTCSCLPPAGPAAAWGLLRSGNSTQDQPAGGAGRKAWRARRRSRRRFVSSYSPPRAAR